MSEWIFLLNEFVLQIIDFSIYLILAGTFFISKRKALTKVWVSILFFAVNYFFVSVFPSILLKEALIILTLVLLTLLLYQARWISSFFVALMYMAILNLSDLLILYAFMIMSGKNLTALQAFPFLYSMASFVAKIFELLLVSLICFCNAAYFKHGLQHMGLFLKFGIYPLVSLISAVLLYYAAIHDPNAAPTLLFCVIFLLVTDILTIFLMGQFENQQMKLNNSYILHRQLDLAMEHIAAANQSYQNERKLTHDFKNQLMVIRGMLERSVEVDQIIAYMEQIVQYTNFSALSVSTNRTAADILFNQKYIISRQKGIDFQVRLDDLSGFPLPDNALVVLLSNLLDNAIDACDAIPVGREKWILIKMNTGKEECLLSVENTVANPIKIENNQIQTTKSDGTRHGYGMLNITSIIHSYEGYFTMKCDDQTFHFVATFPGAQKDKIIGQMK